MKKYKILKERKDNATGGYDRKVIHKYFPDKETAQKYCDHLNRKQYKDATWKVKGVVK